MRVFGCVDFMRHHALGEQRVKRLDRLGGQVTRFRHRACKKTGVK